MVVQFNIKYIFINSHENENELGNDILFRFLRIQYNYVYARGGLGSMYFPQCSEVFKNLLELIFNRNELHQKILGKCGVDVNDDKNKGKIFTSLNDINTLSNVYDNGNYLMHYVMLCSSGGRESQYFSLFWTFLYESMKKNKENSNFKLDCTVYNNSNDSMIDIMCSDSSGAFYSLIQQVYNDENGRNIFNLFDRNSTFMNQELNKQLKDGSYFIHKICSNLKTGESCM